MSQISREDADRLEPFAKENFSNFVYFIKEANKHRSNLGDVPDIEFVGMLIKVFAEERRATLEELQNTLLVGMALSYLEYDSEENS